MEIALQHGCSPVSLVHIFRTPFYKNIYEGLLLYVLQVVIAEQYVFINIIFLSKILSLIYQGTYPKYAHARHYLLFVLLVLS